MNKVTSLAKLTKPQKFKFSSNSATPRVSPLKELGKGLVSPKLEFTPDTWKKMWYIIDQSPKEIGWWCCVERNGNNFLATSIIIPEQVVTAAETDITPEALTAEVIALASDGGDPSAMYFWGHSHVNMGVSPSGQDEDQVSEYLEDVDIFIRGIFNKRRDCKVDIYDTVNNEIHECVPCHLVEDPLSDAATAELDAILKEKVSTPVYKGYNHWSNGQTKTYPRQQQPLTTAKGTRSMGKLDDPLTDDLFSDDNWAGYNEAYDDPLSLFGPEHPTFVTGFDDNPSH